eukprot:scaffold472_cov264-Pinguiococcus_pyrenoidosus.AAC.4
MTKAALRLALVWRREHGKLWRKVSVVLLSGLRADRSNRSVVECARATGLGGASGANLPFHSQSFVTRLAALCFRRKARVRRDECAAAQSAQCARVFDRQEDAEEALRQGATRGKAVSWCTAHTSSANDAASQPGARLSRS